MFFGFVGFFFFFKSLTLLSTVAFIGANRSVKELTSFVISFQQMVKPLFSAPLFSKLVHENNACASGLCLRY